VNQRYSSGKFKLRESGSTSINCTLRRRIGYVWLRKDKKSFLRTKGIALVSQPE